MTVTPPTIVPGPQPSGLRGLVDDLRRRRWVRRTLPRLFAPLPERFGAFGKGSVVVPPALIDKPELVFIGDGVVVHEGTWLSIVQAFEDEPARLELHDGVRVGRFCQFSSCGHIVIGEGAMVGDHVLIADTYHPPHPTAPWFETELARPRRVTIGPGAAIDTAAAILHGVTIGANAYVAPGSVVTRDVPPGGVVSGNPARAWERPSREQQA